MKKPLRVLMVEDSEDDVLLVIRELKKGGYEPEYERVQTAEAMRAALREKSWEVILCDYRLPQFSGLAAIDLLKETHIDTPLIIVSGAIGEETAADCMRSGAHDYVTKGNMARLVPTIERELKEAESRVRRRRAEEGMKRSQRLLAETERVGKVGGWEFNIDTGKQLWTEEIYHIHEVDLSYEPTLEKGILFYTPASRPIIEQAVQQALKHGSSFDVKLEIITAKGNLRSVHAIGKADPEHRRVYGFFQDITEQKRIEEELIARERSYRTLAENLPGIVYRVHAREKGRMQFFNNMLATLTGYDENELMKGEVCSIDPLIVAEDRERIVAEVNAAIEDTRSFYLEYRITHKDGTPRFFIERGRPIIDDEGLQYIDGIIQDVTVRKRAEEALRSSERRLSDIIEFLPDATLAIDMEGKVIAWNRAIEEMTRVRAEEMLGKGNYEYALPFYGERRPILIDLALHPQLERDKSYRNIRKRGDILFGETDPSHLPGGKTHLSVTASVLRNAEGEVVAAIECIRDDTERRQTLEDLRLAEERYRSIFENAPEGIFRSTPEGSIILANPAMAKMLGYDSPEEVIACMTDVARQLYVTPEERAVIRKIIEEIGPVINRETQFYRKDGGIFWGSLTMQAVWDEKEQHRHYEGMIEDITERKKGFDRLRKSLGATIQAIAVMVETKDPYTAGHQRRVADLVRVIAMEMGLSADQIDGVRMAAVIHDLGKISVPAEILSKPTKITALEFCLIKTHAQSGYDILKDIEFPWPIARIVLEHHERMDGSGYPNGLIAEETLLESRILAVADVVESIASHRPYRPALGIDVAMEEIEKNRGMLYDSTVADVCLRLFRRDDKALKGLCFT